MAEFLANAFPFLLSVGFFLILWIIIASVTRVKKEVGSMFNFDPNDLINQQIHQHFTNSQSNSDWQQHQFFQHQQSNNDSDYQYNHDNDNHYQHHHDNNNYDNNNSSDSSYYDNGNSYDSSSSFDSGSSSFDSGSSSSDSTSSSSFLD